MPYALEFQLFIFSIVSFVSSLLCLAVDLAYTWRTGEPYSYTIMRSPLEYSSKNPNVRTNPQKAENVEVDPPSRGELQLLKKALGIKKGSLQYKRRGSGIYLVTYEHGKHRWKHVGSWIQLKEKLHEQNSSN